MKIEFDLPEFEKEIKVEITIRKDGEVVCSTTSSPTNSEKALFADQGLQLSLSEKSDIESKKSTKSTKTSKDSATKKPFSMGGNMMGADY